VEQSPIIVGRLAGVYGVKGWQKLLSFTDIPESIFEYQPWMLMRQGNLQEFTVSDWKRHNKGYIVKLEQIEQREAAQALTGLDIYVNSTALPELDEDEYYWRDLVGMQVITEKGYNLGVVTELLETGSNDVLVVKANSNDAFGQQERLLPFLEGSVIIRVDKADKQIVVDWDPGF
jgi:16S rRNA processing protein RimM